MERRVKQACKMDVSVATPSSLPGILKELLLSSLCLNCCRIEAPNLEVHLIPKFFHNGIFTSRADSTD
uniref:Uncharacterized protein n=1 Tax=Urocitellus parryii TaxID=9999 RepID=A0A8D2HLR1_UROPR